jgi:hypothetical protein
MGPNSLKKLFDSYEENCYSVSRPERLPYTANKCATIPCSVIRASNPFVLRLCWIALRVNRSEGMKAIADCSGVFGAFGDLSIAFFMCELPLDSIDVQHAVTDTARDFIRSAIAYCHSLEEILSAFRKSSLVAVSDLPKELCIRFLNDVVRLLKLKDVWKVERCELKKLRYTSLISHVVLLSRRTRALMASKLAEGGSESAQAYEECSVLLAGQAAALERYKKELSTWTSLEYVTEFMEKQEGILKFPIQCHIHGICTLHGYGHSHEKAIERVFNREGLNHHRRLDPNLSFMDMNSTNAGIVRAFGVNFFTEREHGFRVVLSDVMAGMEETPQCICALVQFCSAVRWVSMQCFEYYKTDRKAMEMDGLGAFFRNHVLRSISEGKRLENAEFQSFLRGVFSVTDTYLEPYDHCELKDAQMTLVAGLVSETQKGEAHVTTTVMKNVMLHLFRVLNAMVQTDARLKLLAADPLIQNGSTNEDIHLRTRMLYGTISYGDLANQFITTIRNIFTEDSGSFYLDGLSGATSKTVHSVLVRMVDSLVGVNAPTSAIVRADCSAIFWFDIVRLNDLKDSIREISRKATYVTIAASILKNEKNMREQASKGKPRVHIGGCGVVGSRCITKNAKLKVGDVTRDIYARFSARGVMESNSELSAIVEHVMRGYGIKQTTIEWTMLNLSMCWQREHPVHKLLLKRVCGLILHSANTHTSVLSNYIPKELVSFAHPISQVAGQMRIIVTACRIHETMIREMISYISVHVSTEQGPPLPEPQPSGGGGGGR